MFKHFQNYRLVYGFLWQTFFKSWSVRFSYLLRFLSETLKIVVQPIVISMLIASIATGNWDGAWHAVLFYLANDIIMGIFNPLSKAIGFRGDSIVYGQVMAQFFAKMMQTDINYFNSNMSGQLTVMARQFVTSSVRIVRDLRDKYMTVIISLIFPVIVVFFVDWLLGLVVSSVAIIQIIYLFWATNKLEPYRQKARDSMRRNSGLISDAISNVLAIRASAQEKSYVKKIESGARQEVNLYVKKYNVQAIMVAGRDAIITVFFLSIFAAVIWRASSGAIDFAGAVLVINYLITIIAAASQLQNNVDEHDTLIDEALPGFEILNRDNKVKDPPQPEKFSKVRGNIELKDVSFAYEEETTTPHHSGSNPQSTNSSPNSQSNTKAKSVFQNFNLTIPHGQKLGVVGLSGAGKSTLAKLILRFDDVRSGEILIDNHDVRKVLQTDLYRKIAYVPQEPLLFHATIRENIAVAKPDATDAEIEKALRATHAWNFVKDLPERLNSIVGERGVKLSGGQKQRIAIARAVLQDAPIMVLDEATSALDSDSEQIIKNSFSEILRGKTAIIIAHRLSTLSDMDRIIVIEKGRLAEDGTHNELMKKNGIYARLWKRQLKNQDEIKIS